MGKSKKKWVVYQQTETQQKNGTGGGQRFESGSEMKKAAYAKGSKFRHAHRNAPRPCGRAIDPPGGRKRGRGYPP
jgi:hypothetical protein